MKEFRAEQRTLRDLIVNLMWHMRGSVSREEAWAMSPQERADILHVIEERLKVVKETGLPLL